MTRHLCSKFFLDFYILGKNLDDTISSIFYIFFVEVVLRIWLSFQICKNYTKYLYYFDSYNTFHGNLQQFCCRI